MSNFRPVPDRTPDVIDSSERIHRQASKARFQMFFAGLIFAVLSFVGAHPIQLNNIFFKWIEIISLFLLLFSGMILLAQLSGVGITPKDPEKITCQITIKLINFINIQVLSRQWLYCLFFLLGMTSIIIDRSAALLGGFIGTCCFYVPQGCPVAFFDFVQNKTES